ncbi:MAG: hypothetical protein VX777_08100 [Chlamydiota bacterium]|nr:hypothetical protein [Chlamydiota bacterium]
MSEENIESIAKITRKKGPAKVPGIHELPVERVAPDKEKFDAALKTDTSLQASKVEPTKQTSLMDEIRNLNKKVDRASQTDPQKLAVQSQEVIAQIEQIKTQLTDPSLEIKNDYKRILRNKLEHIDGNLKVALDKAGLEYIPPEVLEGADATPTERFLTLLTDGQEKLKTLGGELKNISDSKGTITPANLLMVQIKVNYIQQEIEFFTSVLNKALESTKTIMNVQV